MAPSMNTLEPPLVLRSAVLWEQPQASPNATATCSWDGRWGVEPSTNSQWIAHHPKFGWTSSKMDNTSLNPQPILSHLMFGETWSISIETYGDHWMRPVIVILFFGKLPKISFASQVTWLSHTSMAETSSRIHPTWRQNRAAQLAKDNHSEPGSLRKSVASPSSSPQHSLKAVVPQIVTGKLKLIPCQSFWYTNLISLYHVYI